MRRDGEKLVFDLGDEADNAVIRTALDGLMVRYGRDFGALDRRGEEYADYIAGERAEARAHVHATPYLFEVQADEAGMLLTALQEQLERDRGPTPGLVVSFIPKSVGFVEVVLPEIEALAGYAQTAN